MAYLHFDEVKPAAKEAVREWLASTPGVTHVLIIHDLFGKVRVVIWSPSDANTAPLENALKQRCGPWWSGDLLLVAQADKTTQELYEKIWTQGHADPDEPRLRVLGRHRSRTAWFENATEPLWPVTDGWPPIVVFYSFKGGLGRSTILASFAIQRAQLGDRVCVLDLDLDAPGVGQLLAADAEGRTAQWGIVDFLLEHGIVNAPLADYYHRCDRVAGTGEILVFPAGRMNDDYADKLGRLDLEETPWEDKGGLSQLLQRVREELRPKWVLLDARTGISESAGALLSGFSHLHVLVGTTQEQSWEGLNVVLDRLGRARVERGQPQADVVLVQGMVPAGEAGRIARDAFLSRAEREFTDRYYASEDADNEWSLADLDTSEAPHVPIPVDYDTRLASFGDIAEVAGLLSGGAYAEIAERIAGRFADEESR